MLALKCALQQIACKRLTPSLMAYAHMHTSNSIATVASWSTNYCLHSGVPEISSGECELACGRMGYQRLLKDKLQITKLLSLVFIAKVVNKSNRGQNDQNFYRW